MQSFIWESEPFEGLAKLSGAVALMSGPLLVFEHLGSIRVPRTVEGPIKVEDSKALSHTAAVENNQRGFLSTDSTLDKLIPRGSFCPGFKKRLQKAREEWFYKNDNSLTWN